MAVFLVADCVTVNSRHVVLSLLVDRLTSRRWLPMSLNDDNRPSTRHHSEMTKMGCRSSEGASATAVSMLTISGWLKRVFLRKIFGS